MAVAICLRNAKTMSELLNLTKKKWELFNFTDIFDIKDGYYNKKPPRTVGMNRNEIPFLGATDSNNGITEFYPKETILEWDKVGENSKKHIDSRIFMGNCIAITNNGSVGHAYYQKSEFTCSHDITPIYLKDRELTENIAMFLIPLIEQVGSRYKYANKWRPKRMRTSKLKLPIIEQGIPDWNFMEQYIEELKSQIDSNVPTFQSNNITDTREITDLEWKSFRLSEICEIKSGVRLTNQDKKEGEIPFIGALDNSNGITGFVSNINDSYDSNVLGVNYNGSGVVISFYHPYKAVFTDDVKRFHLKIEKPNKYHYLFLKVVLLQQKEKYAYGYKFNARRMARQKVMLPVTEDGIPDWNFIEKYMRRMENEVLLEQKKN